MTAQSHAAAGQPVSGSDGSRPAASPLLRIEDLTIGYFDQDRDEPMRIIRNVDLTIDHDTIVGLVGESGSGKTQTARAILKLNTRPLQPLGGHIFMDGVDLLALTGEKLRAIRGNKVAMIFQDPRASLNPLMRIGDQLARIYALHHGISRPAAQAEAIETLRRVGIAGPERVARSYPHQLSGGMCQRVMISLSLGMQPDLLIADEPTTGLDVTIQAQILELIQAAQRETGSSLLLITHDLGVIAEVCQRVAVMYAGRIVEVAPVDELFTHPRHPYTIHLLQASRALEAPEHAAETPAGGYPAGGSPSRELSVGQETYQASLESARDPDATASMVEVSPGHLVLGTPVTVDQAVPGGFLSGRAGAKA
jgi:ABC-type dipeptide/oligopeptide/nickel transport system ATPase component